MFLLKRMNFLVSLPNRFSSTELKEGQVYILVGRCNYIIRLEFFELTLFKNSYTSVRLYLSL